MTIKEFLEKYGKDAQPLTLPMDRFAKTLTWGIGGDQLRVYDRKVESLLLAAELFDAAATALGGKTQADRLEKAWKDLLASQSHDVSLCEFSRFQEDKMPPQDRIEDTHNFTWGALGYNLLDAAQKEGQTVLDASLDSLAARINTADNKQGKLAVAVFNPHDKDRSDIVTTAKLYPLPDGTRQIVVKDRQGRVLPAQLARSTKNKKGEIIAAEVAFPVSKVPSAGYDCYYLEPTTDEATVGEVRSCCRTVEAGDGERILARDDRPGDGCDRKSHPQAQRPRGAAGEGR